VGAPIEVETEPLLNTVRRTSARLDISESRCWALIKEGRLRSVRLDGRRLVPTSAIKEFVAGLEASQRAAS
jgi:hypothetical protein